MNADLNVHEREAAIRRLHAAGLNDCRIAATVGVARETAMRIRQRLNLPAALPGNGTVPTPPSTRVRPADERRAVRYVAGRARDAGECRELLGDARVGRGGGAVSGEKTVPEGFEARLGALLAEVGIEAFSPEVQDLIHRIRVNDVCETCRHIPAAYTGIGVPLRRPGVTHHADCPTLPQLSAENRAALNKRLDELAKARIDSRRFL